MKTPLSLASVIRRARYLTACLALAGAGWAQAQTAELTIYAGAEADNIKYFSEVFAKAHPNIKLNWVRDSTGIIQARVLAEKDNPRADVLFAMAVTSMTGFAQMGMFVPYTPKGMEALNPLYLDRARPANWVGLYGWASSMCFNTEEAKRGNVPKPVKWTDLENPVYRGKITMPHPASSGTGYLMVAA